MRISDWSSDVCSSDLSFAGSSALARQIEAGAPADMFISADEAWMDELARKGLIRRGTRASFLSNRLVLIVPAGAPLDIAIRRGFPLARLLGAGRLEMADPDKGRASGREKGSQYV